MCDFKIDISCVNSLIEFACLEIIIVKENVMQSNTIIAQRNIIFETSSNPSIFAKNSNKCGTNNAINIINNNANHILNLIYFFLYNLKL